MTRVGPDTETTRKVGPAPSQAPKAAASIEIQAPPKAYHATCIAASITSFWFCGSSNFAAGWNSLA